jgi:glucokinase
MTDSAIARPAVTSAPDPDPAYGAPVLALDLGGTYLRTAVVDRLGGLSGRRRTRTPMAQGADAVCAAALASLEWSRDRHVADGGAPPVALGISAPGPLDPTAGVLIDPPNLPRSFWSLPLAPRLGDALGLPWALDRDTQIAVLAEHAFGAGRGFDDIVYLTVSTGIGGGVISGGRLLRGPDGVAGELGHLTIDLDGPECGCGARGHLERLASGTGIARSATDALANGAEAPQLARIAAAIAPLPLEAVHVAEAEAAGDPVAGAILERARRAFAAAIVSIVDIFDPDRVIVGGGIAMAWGERLLGPARDAVAASAFRVQARRVAVVPAELGDDVVLIGTLPLVALALPGVARAGHASSSGVEAASIDPRTAFTVGVS